jgi:transcription elongation factor Elf1
VTTRSCCAVCASDNVRILIPDDPEGSAFRCSACGKRWDESFGMPWSAASVLRAAERRDDEGPSADPQPDRTPAALSRWNCPQCNSARLSFIERMPAGTICQCDDCGRVTMFPDPR